MFALALASGLAASAVAFLLNVKLLQKVGAEALRFAIPALEEVLKSGIASAAGAPLAAAHFIFGSVEAVYEVSGPNPSPGAAVLSLGTHTSFGLLTAWFAARGGLSAAVAAVAVMHALFNSGILRAAADRRGAGRGSDGPGDR